MFMNFIIFSLFSTQSFYIAFPATLLPVDIVLTLMAFGNQSALDLNHRIFLCIDKSGNRFVDS